MDGGLLIAFKDILISLSQNATSQRVSPSTSAAACEKNNVFFQTFPGVKLSV